MSDDKYLDPTQNPMIRTGNRDQGPPAQKNYHSAEKLREAINVIFHSRKKGEVLNDVLVEIINYGDNPNDYRVNHKKLEEVPAELASQIVNAAREIENEKYSDPSQNPMIKTDADV